MTSNDSWTAKSFDRGWNGKAPHKFVPIGIALHRVDALRFVGLEAAIKFVPSVTDSGGIRFVRHWPVVLCKMKEGTTVTV